MKEKDIYSNKPKLKLDTTAKKRRSKKQRNKNKISKISKRKNRRKK